MKKFADLFWPFGLSLLFGLAVFLFWAYGYPHALSYQEQFQMFLLDGQYFADRVCVPGGLSRYVAEFLVQFYNLVTVGALVIAFLLVTLQRLTWCLMLRSARPSAEAGQERLPASFYPLSFLPSVLTWLLMGDESVMLTYVVALLFVLVAMLLVPRALRGGVFPLSSLVRSGSKAQAAQSPDRLSPVAVVLHVLFVLVSTPLLYWVAGPLALLFALYVSPLLSIPLGFFFFMLTSHELPYPLQRLALGLDYYRFPIALPYLMAAIPLTVLLLTAFSCRLSVWLRPARPLRSRLAALVQVALLVALFAVFRPMAFNGKKYELIKYDYLVRLKAWPSIIDQANRHQPDLPMSVSATNLALAMTNQLGDRAFSYFQRGLQGLLPSFERNFTTAQLTGEIYYQLGLVNTAQRFAYESMEALPNYNKSVRATKRLAETNLVNGQYDVARKYLHLLQKTVFYSRWADRTLALLGDEQAINNHPVYGWLRQCQLHDDFLFSEEEIDKICGQLVMRNPQNRVAVQYLMLAPLLQGDVDKFMQYDQFILSKTNYNPRVAQEAIAFAFMQQGQHPPQGMVSPMVEQQMQDFAQAYRSGGGEPHQMQRFSSTLWYYLTFGK